MKNRLFLDENEYNKFFTFVEKNDNTNNKQLTSFLKWCFDNGFFLNITDEDIDFCYEYDELYLPLLKHNHITIGIDTYYNYARIGIDPSKCFNKTSQCSIIAQLPLCKRDNNHFYKILNTIMDKKNPQSREWFKNANTYWYGDYIKFNM